MTAALTRYINYSREARRTECHGWRRGELAEALGGARAQVDSLRRAAAPAPGSPGPPPPASAPAAREPPLSTRSWGRGRPPGPGPGPGPSPRPGRTQPRSAARRRERGSSGAGLTCGTSGCRRTWKRMSGRGGFRRKGPGAALAGGVSAPSPGWRGGRLRSGSCARPCPAPPRAMLLPSDVARLVLGE